MKIQLIGLFCVLPSLTYAAASGEITADDIRRNQGNFYTFIEQEVKPQVLRLAPPETATTMTKSWGKICAWGAETFGPICTKYSAAEIKGAQILGRYFADDNIDGRKRALEALPGDENGINFINILVKQVKDEPDGDARAGKKHTAALEYLKTNGALLVDATPSMDDMAPLYKTIEMALLNPLFTRQLYVQYVCEEKTVS